MEIFLSIVGIILLVVFILNFNENTKTQNISEAIKSGLWSAGGCLVFIIICLIILGQCVAILDSDSFTNRKYRSIESGEYDPYDDAY